MRSRLFAVAVGVVLVGALVLIAPLAGPAAGPWRLAAVAALVAAVLAVLLAERRSARFITALTEAADAVGEGQTPRLGAGATPELHELARAIEAAGLARRAAEDRFRQADADRAELLRRERAARGAAEAAAVRSAFLAEASRLVASSLDDATLSALARLVAGAIADWCVMDLVEAGGTVRRAAVAHADPSRADAARALQLRYPPGPDGPASLREALEHGRPVVIPSLDAAAVERRARNADHLRLLRALGVQSLIVVPLVARSRIVGAITLVRGGGAPYGADDLAVAEELAHRVAMAVDTAHLHTSVHEARERFARLVEGLDAIVWEADPVTLRFTFVSRRAEAILGYPVARWLDEPTFWSEIIHPDDREACLARFARCTRDDVSSRFAYRALAADGRVVWLENVVHAAPPSDAAAPWLHGLMLDVTDRKRLEDEHHRLLASEQAARAEAEAAARRAKFLAEASQVLASSLDYEATLKAVTRLAVPTFADWCLAHLSDDAGQRLQAAHAEAVGDRIAQALERVAESADLRALLPALEALQAGAPLLVPEISPAWLEAVRLVQELSPRSVMIVPLIARGRTIGTLTFVWSQPGRRYDAADLALAEDLARRAAVAFDNARLYREAGEANRAKDEFLATLSHELRTPLTAMLGWVIGLRTGRLGPDQTVRALDSIERNTRHQARLIDDLLEVSRIAAGKLDMERRAVDLRAVVDSAVDSIRPDAESNGVELKTASPTAEVPVFGDATRLQQVVLNLLSNAVKFTPRGGHVTVDLARQGALARLTVEDTGQGIEPDVLPHVFETFRQADGTTTRRHGGLGLGLAIVKHLVEAHGGRVDARSDGRDRGSAFSVTIPILAVRVAGAGEAAGEPRRGAGATLPRLDGVRVLVVDDHADARELVESILTERGAQVLLATSAVEALDTLRTTFVDVLLSDLGMPDVSGFDLIRRVRDLERAHGGRLPAVALTAYAGPDDRDRALAAGFQAHATKPITPVDLIEAVARAAGRTVGS
ncbi:MAG: GAF domain-containing protein [Candidatus Rokubacteria bacterium]|nr:GAF domain-containing protein [Candidatus Rokubacteria bacterium]